MTALEQLSGAGKNDGKECGTYVERIRHDEKKKAFDQLIEGP